MHAAFPARGRPAELPGQGGEPVDHTNVGRRMCHLLLMDSETNEACGCDFQIWEADRPSKPFSIAAGQSGVVLF
jgi:hypothetical protein